jgi:hypothetical protein
VRRGRADGRATREESAGEIGSVWAQERKAGYRRGVIRGRRESRRDWTRSGWSSKGMRRLCGSESRMGASVELRVRGEASLLQRARTCDNRRRGGSGDDGGNGGRAMTTWERGQQFDSLLGVLVLLMLWERCGCKNEQRESAHLRRLLERQPRLWRRGDGGGVATMAPGPTQPKQENAGGPDAPGRHHAGAPAGSARV